MSRARKRRALSRDTALPLVIFSDNVRTHMDCKDDTGAWHFDGDSTDSQIAMSWEFL